MEYVPSSPTYWEAKEVPYSQVLTDYNACKMWSTVKYAESEKREEIITDNLGYWIHVPLLKACMEHKGYKYVGPEAGHRLQPQEHGREKPADTRLTVALPPKMPHQPHDKILRVVTSFDPANPDLRVVVLEFAKQRPFLTQHIPGARDELKSRINLGVRLSTL